MALGFILVLLAGLMNGSFATPMKRVRGWRWEHTWLVWAFSGCLVFPVLAALVTIPDLVAVYGGTPGVALARTAFFGLLWGASAVLFGLGVDRLGVALGFGLIIGISSALGALVPLVLQHPGEIGTEKGLTTLAGILVVVLGVAACAQAGHRRERAGSDARRGSVKAGLVICLLSGLGAPAVNFGLAFAGEIIENARGVGAAGGDAVNAVWPVLFAAGFLPNAAWCGRLIGRGAGWRTYLRERPSANFPLAALMGLLWFGSNLVYGYGSNRLGALGLVLGWPVFMGAIVLTANGWGVATGEWRGCPAAAMRWLGAGIVLLISGVGLIGHAGGL